MNLFLSKTRSAHNGDNFDFPIFLSEIESTIGDKFSIFNSIVCGDSLRFFREKSSLFEKHRINSNEQENLPVSSFDSMRKISMKLSDIYEREFDDFPAKLQNHRAEDDCLMLIAILKRYLNDWLPWLDENHRPLKHFSDLNFESNI